MGEDFPIVPQELMCNRIVPVIRVWKQWTDKHRTTRKTGSERRTPAPGSHSKQTINVCNGLMSTEPGKLIGTKLSFQMNHASVYGTMMATFVLDAMPMNAAFQSALSNDIVA
ncbi:uncharacterized protein TNCV_2908191 [Trichonephila clavipes]|nr:uncharacterized protein TNCV_2908191 [Trichonephila clavipes]